MTTALTLVIGNKNYSSWSLRPWLAMRMAGVAFEELVLPFGLPDWKAQVTAISPAGRVPVLIDASAGGRCVVWESLAICDHVARLAPAAGLWPESPEARSFCMSISSEMHAGFAGLRRAMPMNVRKSLPGRGREPGAIADIERITAIWREARARFGAGGPFLLGRFSMADAMYAPVAFRFATYGVALDPVSAAWRDTILSTDPMREWAAAARAEPWIVPEDEID
jgi:glutathione S-transferase